MNKNKIIYIRINLKYNSIYNSNVEKAFDRIDHKLLVNKLKYYGFAEG